MRTQISREFGSCHSRQSASQKEQQSCGLARGSCAPEPQFGHHFSRVSVLPSDRARNLDSADFLRDHICLQNPDPSLPVRKVFSERERQRASFGLWSARSIASRAFGNLGNRDPHHLRIAERTFGPGIDFPALDQHVSRIRNVLDSLSLDQNVWAGTCDEPGCNTGSRNAVAITLDDLSGIVLCPFFFTLPATTFATTFLHEAGHMANIDINFTPGGERYCYANDSPHCDNICPLTGENLLENVDAWARFIYCVSVSS